MSRDRGAVALAEHRNIAYVHALRLIREGKVRVTRTGNYEFKFEDIESKDGNDSNTAG